MVEGGGLENRWAFAGSVGSNPTSSVCKKVASIATFFIFTLSNRCSLFSKLVAWDFIIF